MKRLILIIVIICFSLNAYTQDTTFVYQENGMIRIDDFESVPIFLTPGQVSYRISGTKFILKNGITKLEYDLGAFTNIFKEDTTGFPSQDSTINYLNKILNRAVSNVTVLNKTTDPIIIKFNRIDESTSLKAATAIEDTFIVVNSVTESDIGDYIIVFSPSQNRFYKGNVLSINVDTLFMDTPLDAAFEVDDFVDVTETNMAVDGSVTNQIFGIRGVSPQPIGVDLDITRIIFSCLTDDAVNISTFADIEDGITNGLVLRKRDGDYFNIFNAKTNGDLIGLGYDFTVYSADNPAQGQNGFTFRLTFSGKEKMDLALRLTPGEDLEFLIRDDLSGITLYEVTAEGQIVPE